MSENNSASKVSIEDFPSPIAELRSLIRERKITKDLFERIEFKKLLEKISECAASDDPSTVWISISTLGRMASISKPAERIATPLIAQRLSNTLPDAIRLDDGEDRYYLAKGLETTENKKIVDLAFKEIAEEDVAETARRVWVTIALKNSATLTEFLKRINKEISLTIPSLNDNPDAICRRIRRINSSVEDVLATAETKPGEDIGIQLRSLYLSHLPNSGPIDRDLRDDTSEDFLSSLKRIARLNFVARTDPVVYRIVDGIRRWWRPASPPKSFEIKAEQITRLGVESLLSFAKQGVMNKPLREALTTASNKQTVERAAREFASQSLGIEPDIAYWFINGTEPRETRSIRAVDAISETKLDEYIAHLLISLESSELQGIELEQALKDVVDIMPAEGETLSRASKRFSQVAQWSRAIARMRRIELSPLQNETVSYDPSVHAGDDDLKIGISARVLTSGAIRKIQGDIQVVLIRAEVERLYG
ncbi:hypothetical protein [Stappia sp.]|uniref:hypothetical protein n=1 Tax=Stappia sp. TaxID=1870903 RepID=UPI003A995450